MAPPRASCSGANRICGANVMDQRSNNTFAGRLAMKRRSPILIVPYMWIGDFVRCHSVVQVAAGALPRPAGRHAGDDAVRAADRLHARPAPGHRRRSSAQAPGSGAAASARRASQARRLWHRADHAAHLESGAGAVFRRHSRTHRFRRRGAVFPAQRLALRRARLAAHGRSLRRAGAAARRQLPARLAGAGAQGATAPRSPLGAPVAVLPPTAGRSWRWRPARSDRPSAGRARPMPR